MIDNADILHELSYNGILSKSVSTDYTFTDNDKIKTLFVTTGASDITITLPTAADNLDRVIEIFKVDDGAGKVIIDGEGAETIDGYTTYDLLYQYHWLRLKSDGSNWYIVGSSNWLSACGIYLSADQTITTGASQIAQLNSEYYDIGNEWDTTNYKFEPNKKGIFSCRFSIGLSNPGDGQILIIYPKVNGSIVRQYSYHSANNTRNLWVSGAFDIELSPNDDLTLYVQHTSGGNETLYGTINNSTFEIHQVV